MHTHTHTLTHTHTHTDTHIYIYIDRYIVYSISSKTFFVRALIIGVDSSKFSMLLLYILCDHGPFFIISGSNEQLQQELEYILLKPDFHSWWISILQTGRETWKNAKETYGMLQTAFRPSCMNRASILSGLSDSREARSLWGMMRGVRGVRKSTHQSWLVKGLGLGLLCWGFKGIQEVIPRKKPALLKSGQWHFHRDNACPLLHPCHRLFDEDGHQHSSSPSL